MNRIKRAKTADRFMTIIFYCIAVFFFMLLAAFAGYVIIKGFAVQMNQNFVEIMVMEIYI